MLGPGVRLSQMPHRDIRLNTSDSAFRSPPRVHAGRVRSTGQPSAVHCQTEQLAGSDEPQIKNTAPGPFRRFNASPEVIRVVMMYVRLPPSLRHVEDRLFERGTDFCHETFRMW